MANEDDNQSQSAAEIQTKSPFAPACAPGRSNSALVDHHSLLSEFGNRFARFAEAFATHALQYCLVFCKLDIRVLHDLHAVSPGISELHPSPWQDFGAGFLHLLSHLLLVVYHEATMALFVWRLSPTFGESNELIAHVDEGHLRAPPPKREFEQAAIERKRLFDVPDLQGHVVHADEPCFATQILYHFHDITSGIGANVKWSAGRATVLHSPGDCAAHQVIRGPKVPTDGSWGPEVRPLECDHCPRSSSRRTPSEEAPAPVVFGDIVFGIRRMCVSPRRACDRDQHECLELIMDT